jgi:DNA-binding CsgD family transcriptional regulator
VQLLERGPQLAQADAALADAAHGAGRTLLVEGAPGIGKSAFLETAVGRARARPTATLVARSSELEQGFAFGVVRQLFERRVTETSPGERRELLAGAAGLAAPLVTARRRAPAGHQPPDDEAYPVLHGLYWLCANLAARRPLLLAVDDAHWADGPSLRFCAYLAHRLGELPVVLLLTTRSPADPRLAPLQLEPTTVSIPLPALSPAAVDALVQCRLGEAVEPTLGPTCHRLSGGNPFLVGELLTWLGSLPEPTTAAALRGAPPTVRASVQHRLRRLGVAAPKVAAAAAVLDGQATVRRTAALAGLSPEETDQTADRLVEAGILAPGRPLAFVHALVRTAVLEATPESERRRLAEAAARCLGQDRVEAPIVARHLAAVDAIGEPWVVEMLTDAAEQALAHGDPATATVWLRRALEEPVQPECRARLLRRLGLAEARLGDAAASEHLRAAFALFDDPRERAQTLRPLLLGMLAEGRGDEVLRMLDASLPGLAAGDPDLVEQIEAEILSAARHTTTASLWAADRLRSWRGRANPDRPGGRLLLANLATQCALDGGPADEAARLAELALGDGRLLEEQTSDTLPVFQAVWQLTAAERLDRAEQELDRALADARRRGSVAGFALGSTFHSYLELARGRVAAAEADATAALAATRETEPGVFLLPAIVAALLDVLVQQARLGEALRLLGEHGWTGELPDSNPYRLLLHSRGHVRLAAGAAADATRDFLEHLERERRLQALSTHLVPSQAGAALALLAAGEPGRAAAHADRALAEARAWSAPRTVGRALRVRARLAPPPDAATMLEEATRLLERSPARLEEAWVRLDLGVALVRLRRRSDGATELRRALDLGHRTGGTAVADAARAELVASGYRPRRAAASGVAALTGSERRVAQMAASALTNREIAQVLFVTERTVELHLANAYRKLGVGSRRELPPALRETP